MGNEIADYQQMVSDCIKRVAKLSDWEKMFIESINTQLGLKRPLTGTQIEKLDSIWETATAKG